MKDLVRLYIAFLQAAALSWVYFNIRHSQGQSRALVPFATRRLQEMQTSHRVCHQGRDNMWIITSLRWLLTPQECKLRNILYSCNIWCIGKSKSRDISCFERCVWSYSSSRVNIKVNLLQTDQNKPLQLCPLSFNHRIKILQRVMRHSHHLRFVCREKNLTAFYGRETFSMTSS